MVAAAALTAAERAPLAAAPSLRDVMARIGTYAAAYGDSLASVVADEDYLQQLTLRGDGAPLQERRLESEIAFVRLGSATEWLAFRSVLRVDGAAVSDGAGRLERVFRDAPGSALGRARAITAESARHNIGPVQRNFNVPTTVLHFILPENQDRFRFSKKREERHAAETVWLVEFREHGRSSFIRTPEGRRAPAEGLLWVAPEDGRVVRSRLVVKADAEAEIEVAWQRDARLALWVPVEMREVYRAPWLKTTDVSARPEAYDVRGIAKYSNYRRFEVDARIVR
jgi:hypothetical protein